ncbi:MAG: hypothetical protein ACLGHQ_14720 [Acidimicrobiia bacterium]
MFTVCWAAKGGSGTTVVTATLALSCRTPTLLVDLAGDLPMALGLPTPEGPGLGEWSSSTAPASRLDALRIPLAPHLDLLPRGHRPPIARWRELSEHLATRQAAVFVDAGTGAPPPELCAAADRTLLVTRPCYLAVRRAVDSRQVVDGIVLVEEPGRALGVDDIETALGAPVVCHLLLDPAVARAVDAGLLLAKLPGAYRRGLEVAA